MCCYASLLCDRVVNNTGLAGCLGPSRPVRKGVTSLAPRSLEADREGKKSIRFVCLVGAQDLHGLITRGRERMRDALGHRERLLAS